MDHVRIATTEVIPEGFAPDPQWPGSYAIRDAVTLLLPNNRSAVVFLDKKVLGSADEVNAALSSEMTVGHVISCFGEHWTIDIEPTEGGRFGVIVYAASGKALMHGMGVHDAGRWSATVNTLYPGIRNSRPISAQIGVRGGTGQKTEIEGGIGGSF
jgi:hypothetical protein